MTEKGRRGVEERGGGEGGGGRGEHDAWQGYKIRL